MKRPYPHPSSITIYRNAYVIRPSPRRWNPDYYQDDNKVLSAAQIFACWIFACAGMSKSVFSGVIIDHHTHRSLPAS